MFVLVTIKTIIFTYLNCTPDFMVNFELIALFINSVTSRLYIMGSVKSLSIIVMFS